MTQIELAQAGGQAASASQWLRTLWRRRQLIAIVMGVLFACTITTTVLWPPVYRSTGTILIEQQEIPQDIVRSTITSYADQRVQVIGQRVTTTQNLLALIDRYNLYPSDRASKPREVLLRKFRGDMAVNMISADVIDPRSGRPTQATIAFSVAFQNRSPDLAVKVANELTSLYLNENLASRSQSTQQTTTFLSEEAVKLGDQIAKLEARLAAFKSQHANELPELTPLNNQLMDRTELELQESRNRIGSLDGQRAILTAQLAQMSPTSQLYSESGQRILGPEDRLKMLRTQLASLESNYSSDHPDVVKTRREIAGLESQAKPVDGSNDLQRQLTDARTQLAAASQKYSADHPNVVRLQRQVHNFEALVASDWAKTGVRPGAGAVPDNLAYIQVKGQLDAIEAERTAEQHRQLDLATRLAGFQKRLGEAPAVEKEYRELMRDYENAQGRYQLIKSKEGEAKVSQNLETEQKGERFTLIEPPLAPEAPVSPNRPMLFVLGTLFSIALAVGVAVLAELVDGAIRGPRDVLRMLEVPPIAVIPVINTAADLRRRVLRLRYAAAAGVATIIMAVLAIHLFFRPLDILWVQVQRRLGL
jgi:uncharacterized protein involved in exopolysaccharide biosynthesis